jgi:TRAP-type C4-dicarboxylate transport system permease large subunit
MDITKTSCGALVRAMLPFYLPIIITLLVITFIPAVTLFLPNLVTGGG